MKTLIIINDAPYGTEIAFNALRIANQLGRDYKDDIEVRIFLMAGIIDWNNGNGRGDWI